MRNNILLHNFLLVLRNFLFKCQTYAASHQFFNLPNVGSFAILSLLSGRCYRCAAVIIPDMLEEVGSVADQVTLERVNEGTMSFIETVGTAYLE